MSESPPNNLPAQLTTLIGRSREIEALTRLLLDDTARLVTLTGAGGSGKTRLAIELASSIFGRYSAGAFLTNLAPITEPQLIWSAVAQTLGVRESGRGLLAEDLKTYLHDRRLLLLLDNFEQVIEGAPFVADLLRACPALQIVVTSRAALHIRGEREFPVPPLALPDRSQPLDLAGLERYAATRLFVERARAVNPDLDIALDAGRDIAEICSRLDGLPLAIELAAARTRLLPPAAILARLDRRFALLADGARDLPERQRTLRNAIAWSYDLLDSSEQALFRRLSVFPGSCSLEAVAAVSRGYGDTSAGAATASGDGAGLGETEVLEEIASLVDKNLVRPSKSAGAEPRFELLETVREFGLEGLAAHAEAEQTERLAALFFLTLAEDAERQLADAAKEAGLRRLEREHDNLRASLRWFRDHGRAEEGLRLAGALGEFWQLRGYAGEGRRWLDAVLGLGQPEKTPQRAKALTAAGILAVSQHDYAVARAYHEQALEIHRELQDDWSAAIVVNDLGTVALYQGDYPTARHLYEQSLGIRQRLGDQRGSAVSLTNLGLVAAAQGELSRAREFHEQALARRRELADRAGLMRSLAHLGVVASEQHDNASANAFLREAAALAREDGDAEALARCLTRLSAVAFDSQDPDEAAGLVQEAVALQREQADRTSLPWSLWYLARLAIARGDLSVARDCSDEALALVRETGDKHGLALWLDVRGDVAVSEDDYGEARAAHEEGLQIRRQLGDEGGAAVIMAKLAEVLHHGGDAVRARVLLEESVEVLRRLDDRPALAASLTNLAQLLLAQGDLGASEARYREGLALQHELGKAAMIELCLRGLASLARSRGDEERVRRLQDFRGEIPLSAAALEYAVGPGLSKRDTSPPGSYPDGLSEREVQVLRLVAAGKSNQAIAGELVISVNTVFRHVSNVFAKIGAGNRVEAAGYAQRHGLV